MIPLDLVAITQALREAAEQIRALPDGELVAMALRAQTSESGRQPASVPRPGSPAARAPRAAVSRRAEAPKSPAPTPAPHAEEVPERGARPQRGGARRCGPAAGRENEARVLKALAEHPKGLSRSALSRAASVPVGSLTGVMRRLGLVLIDGLVRKGSAT